MGGVVAGPFVFTVKILVVVKPRVKTDSGAAPEGRQQIGFGLCIDAQPGIRAVLSPPSGLWHNRSTTGVDGPLFSNPPVAAPRLNAMVGHADLELVFWIGRAGKATVPSQMP